MVSRLQGVDSQLKILELEKGDLPSLVKNLDGEINRRESEKGQLEGRMAEAAKQKRTNDGQAQLLRVKLDKFKEQLYSVTTNREYDAINQEIEAARGELEIIEAAQKALEAEEESLQNQVGDILERISEVESELEERQGELGTRNEETESEETELLEEREKLVARIKKPIVAHYERIRKVREGIGAAHLYAGACGACFAVVPPQRQAEIRKMNDIILCESCGVIILPEEENMGNGEI